MPVSRPPDPPTAGRFSAIRALANLSIGTKVMLAPLVALATLGALSLFGGEMLDRQREVIIDEYARVEPSLVRALTLPERLASIEAELYKLALWSSIGTEGEPIKETRATIRRRLNLAGADIADLKRAGVEGAAELVYQFGKYRKSVSQALMLIARNPVLGATAVRGTESLYSEVERRTRSLAARTLRDLRISAIRADLTAAQIARAFLVVSLVAALLVMGISLLVSRAITVPLGLLLQAIRNLQRGSLDKQVPMIERRDELGEVARVVRRFREILLDRRNVERERERQRRELHHLAHHDGLTGLANRPAMNAFISRALGDRRSGTEAVAFLVLDLTGFKPVNDAYGHAAGDAVLVEVAARLQNVTRQGDLAARLGGDEFGIVATGMNGREDVERLAARVAELFETPVRCRGREVLIGASIGGALSADTGADADALLAAADHAMYAAKQDSAPWKIYLPADAQAEERRECRAALERAIRRQQMVACYQPIVRIDAGELAGYGVHVRWRHPAGGMVDPGEFLGEVEDAGLLTDMSFAAARQVLETVSDWLAGGLDPGWILLPTLGPALAVTAGAESLDWLLTEFPEAASRVTLEIPERCLDARAGPTILSNLARLTGRGMRAAIGGFGSGGGGLALLSEGRFEAITIGGDIVGGIGRDPATELVLDAVLGAAVSIGIEVVASGVVSAEQERHLRERGCAFATGERYGALAEATEAAERLKRAEPPVSLRA